MSEKQTGRSVSRNAQDKKNNTNTVDYASAAGGGSAAVSDSTVVEPPRATSPWYPGKKLFRLGKRTSELAKTGIAKITNSAAWTYFSNMMSRNPEINEYIKNREPDFNLTGNFKVRKSIRIQEIEERKKITQFQVEIPLTITEIEMPGKTNEIESAEIDIDNENISQIMEKDADEKKRQNTDTPCWELLNAIIVVGADYSKCKTIENLIELIDANSTRIIFADRGKKNAYYSDLRRRNNDVVKKYLKDCETKMPVGLKTILGYNCENVVECFVYGKTVPQKSEVEQLNMGLDKKESKGDLYIKIRSPNGRHQFLAIDNKMSEMCTSSNYAVWVTSRGGLIKDDSWKELCSEALKESHKSMGANNSRDSLQKDLHDVDHVVWSNYIEGIAEHTEQMKRKLIELLFCHTAQERYPIYKFDGNQWTDYTKYRRDEINFDTSRFERNPLKQTGDVAKIFYTLAIAFKDRRPSMIVECFIRFKFTNFKSNQIVGDVLAQLNMLPQFPEQSCGSYGKTGGGSAKSSFEESSASSFKESSASSFKESSASSNKTKRSTTPKKSAVIHSTEGGSRKHKRKSLRRRKTCRSKKN